MSELLAAIALGLFLGTGIGIGAGLLLARHHGIPHRREAPTARGEEELAREIAVEIIKALNDCKAALMLEYPNIDAALAYAHFLRARVRIADVLQRNYVGKTRQKAG